MAFAVLGLSAGQVPDSYAEDAVVAPIGRERQEASEAQDAPADSTDPDQDPSDQEYPYRVDAGHARVSAYVGEVADRIDRFFVDERVDEGYNRSRVRLRGGYRLSSARDDEPVVDVKVNLWLPGISDRLSLILSSPRNDETVQDSDVTQRDDDAKGLTLRYFFLDQTGVTLNADASVRWKDNRPNPRFRLRGRRDWSRGKVLIRGTQFLFWELNDGLGTGTRLDFDRRFGSDRLGRYRIEAEYSQATQGVEMQGTLSLFQTFGPTAGIRLEFGVRAQTEPTTRVEEYVLGYLFRRQIYSNWLYVLLEPRMRFPRDRDFDPSPEALVQLEVLLGEEYVREYVGNRHRTELGSDPVNNPREYPRNFETPLSR